MKMQNLHCRFYIQKCSEIIIFLGLAFIAYPEAIGLLPAPQLFSLLFFIMLVLLGIDSQFAMVDVLVASTLDEKPELRAGWKKTAVGFKHI